MNNTSKTVIVGLLGVLFLVGCAKTDFAYYSIPQEKQQVSFTSPIREVMNGGAVDVLWVIDNSGSMGVHQAAVIQNAALFMQDFLKYGVKWKMGLVSTDISEDPYLGLEPTDLFDYTDSNPSQRFSSAVSRLGTNGSAIEMELDPILKHLTTYTNFLRGNGTPLAVLIVTDEEEQSTTPFADFRRDLDVLLNGSPLFVYGALDARDLGCTSFQYSGSPFEQFLNSANGGQYFPLCKNFGTSLAAMGSQIVSKISKSAIRLQKRPVLKTLKVFHKGRELKRGLKADGGYWVYDYQQNMVVFHDLDFSQSDQDQVQIDYDVAE